MPLQGITTATTNAGAAAGSGRGLAGPGAITGRRPGDPKTRFGRYLIVVLTGIIGGLASCGMFLAIGNWQGHLAELRFANLASDHLQTLNAGLKDATDLLYSMRAYFESLDAPVTRTEYERFSQSLRERVVGLRDTGWAPRVTRAGRQAFEQAVRASGEPNFQILERNAEGELVRAGDRGEYFPILYSEPAELNRPIMGFDLFSEPMRRRVIGLAQVTDRPAATPPVKLMNVQRPNGGLMSFIPVLDTVAPGDALPRRAAGVVLGAFETAPMIQNILATKLRLAGLDMYVFDPSGPAGNRLIYWYSTSGKPAPDEASVLHTPHWLGPLELVDQRWNAVFSPSDAAEGGVLGGEADWMAVAVLMGGLCMTGLIVGYLGFSLRRTEQLERLTSELRQTSDELRRNGAELDRLARHDALTGLANRTAFRERLAAGLSGPYRGHGVALLYLDLDRFKAVNDTLGHPAGDQLLCQVADRLRDTVRESDTISRLGGDEFAIVQDEADQPHAAQILARRVIDALNRPYHIDGQLVVVGVSIGIVLAERDARDVEYLLRRADLALYAAKRGGRGTSRLFEPAMESDAQAWRGLEMDLRHALEHHEFEVCYQPQVNVADRSIRGFEALLRWHHPDRGLVMPGDFIRCAEETGLILPIGAWVLRTALREAATWPAGVRVAVNLSSCQLARDDLAEAVEAALAAVSQAGTRLELEVTESALIEHTPSGMAALKHLRARGVRIAIDNFGSFHASLSHLRSFPFDRIKIDQAFVAGVTESAEGAALVRAILQLAASLDIATTAAGVETAEQFELLAAMGCGEVQGILFSPARPAGDVSGVLADWVSGAGGLLPGRRRG